MSDIDTVLADLQRDYEAYASSLAGKTQREQFRLADEFYAPHRRRERKIAHLFGALNGWTVSRKPFTPEAIGRAHASWDDCCPGQGTGWMDHAIYFRARVLGRRAGINVAVVGQPYNSLDGYHRELDA
jgi:hypothetical protein